MGIFVVLGVVVLWIALQTWIRPAETFLQGGTP